MPTNHSGNTTNGNQLSGLASLTGYSLTGRTTGLPIYEVRYFDLANNPLAGPNFGTIVKSMVRDNLLDAQNGYRQPTDHDDRLGNLPQAPGGKIQYREYFLTGNTFTWPGFLRLVGDPGSRRLFVTPTHYDVWLQNPQTAGTADTNNLIAPGTAGARNPFFLVTGVGAVNSLFL